MKEKLKIYINNNLEKDTLLFRQMKKSLYYEDSRDYQIESSNISEFINNQKEDNKFQKLLFKLIDERNLKDSDVYNKANIDRRLFSKIRSNENYHPSKETIILLGLSLELNESEIINLLQSASYSLPKNNYFDLIIRFCFLNKIYNVNDVNELLYDYDCKTL